MKPDFGYPPDDIAWNVLGLIKLNKTQDAYDILSEFYNVPRVYPHRSKFLFNVEYPENNKVMAYYHAHDTIYKRPSNKQFSAYVNFSTMQWKKDYKTVLHEFYHHIAHNSKMNIDEDRKADIWADEFLTNIGKIGSFMYVINRTHGIGFKIMLTFLRLIKERNDIDAIKELENKRYPLGADPYLTTDNQFYQTVGNDYSLTYTGEKTLEYLELRFRLMTKKDILLIEKESKMAKKYEEEMKIGE